MNGMEKPTFIKIDKFETVMSALSVIKKRLMEAQITLDKITNLKQEEDATMEKWAADLQAVQAKIQNIESQLVHEE